jgi:uncharacterized protein YndB with AHSA1/START domain
MDQFEAAFAALDLDEKRSFKAVVDQFGLDQTTLSCRTVKSPPLKKMATPANAFWPAWLTHIFQEETKKARNGTDWRLLILDGHGSHVTMRFIDFYAKHRILLCIYPPHSTHWFQPLDISLFAPLPISIHKNSTGTSLYPMVDQGLQREASFVTFWYAWEHYMNPQNIASRWRKPASF